MSEIILEDTLQTSYQDSFLFTIDLSNNLCESYKKYTYDELLEKFADLSKIVENFLPDYFTLRYLERESILDRASIARLAVALSNLLKLCVDQKVDEIHFVTLRIRKIYSETLRKDFFVITDY